MPRILIIYGTTDGQTEKIALWLAERFREANVGADAFHAAVVPGDVQPEHYDGVLIAASVHASGYQRAVRQWLLRHGPQLTGRPTAFLSVCLGVLQPEPEVQREVRATMDRFFAKVGWTPNIAKPVAGALPWSRYGFVKKWVMKRIVTKVQGKPDTSRDVEFTNWDDLKAFVRDFVRHVSYPATNAEVSSGSRRTRTPVAS